eukprot:CAMPEP_0173455024 /NCGR_PEP_ID=MMETSP1357-20121228/53491_1 /TAXON_ID=77926 /ORGANISM="Hemiselmis rufescens, Strain PCC563" /LENGTH=51 /DNA_ID=CAMNT_0014422111 /DNA_START=122 /DNA_END=274 /DNA_ORIENTATION=+
MSQNMLRKTGLRGESASGEEVSEPSPPPKPAQPPPGKGPKGAQWQSSEDDL